MMSTSSYRVVKAFLNQSNYWADKIRNTFGIECHAKGKVKELDPTILRQIYLILADMGANLVKDCGVKTLYLDDMGRSCKRFPNHGYYMESDVSVTLNVNIFLDPDQSEDFITNQGYISRQDHTFQHELFHGFDHFNATNGKDLSVQPEWIELSGWSEKPYPGSEQLIIKEPGMPDVIGEWFHSKDASFPRFYAARSPWEDLADSAVFYIAGLTDTLPQNKQDYFKKLLAKYSK